MIRILIADDHTIFRQGLSSLLLNSDDVEIVAEVSTGVEAWNKIQEMQPDIAILDIRMPGLDGLQVAEKVLQNEISTRIILLTMHDEATIAVKSNKLQVKGYVLKDNTFDELLKAIKCVAAGHLFMSPVIKEKLKQHDPKTELSERESSVLKLVAQGLTNREIGNRLGISPKTVDTYRCRLMSKLDLHSVVELTKHAVKIGLVT